MKPERWKKLEEVYHAAMEREASDRAAFLDGACAGDTALRESVEALIKQSARGSSFLERPAMEVEAESLALGFSARVPVLGDRYTVLEEIGRGGMGIVYRVRDHETDDIVAAKVLHPGIAADQQMIERFKTELKLSRKVTHRNVCRIYDINRSLDTTFISMEYVEGESLRRVLRRLGALSVRKGVEVTLQICEGLEEAHQQGIIHRDLKPENIMLDANGNAKIMDFGIAQLASSRHTVGVGIPGTPSYMSPEQAEGRRVDQRSDIYSLGLVMYEVFTGHVAFSGDTPVAIALKQIREAPPDPRTVEPLLPEEVERVILRCLEKDPEKRFQTLNEIEAALKSSEKLPERTQPQQSDSKVSDWFLETAYVIAPARARAVLLIIQAGYLFLYGTTLYYLEPASRALDRELGLPENVALRLLTFSALAGIAARVYLTSALAFNHPETGRQFWRLFPVLLLLDALWAASPLLLAHRMGFGLALACAALLAYLPFSQKTLISNAYRRNEFRP